MTSLAEAYDDARRGSRRRVYLGTGLFASGAVLVVLGIVFFSTGIGSVFGLGVYGAREVAGVAAGLGVPAVFVGVFTVLPASRRERGAAAIGAAVAVFGVVLFAYAYPEQWVAAGPGHLTLPVVIVYFLGAITSFWSLFTAVLNFKTRNDPGGTVTLERIVDGRTRRVEVPVAELRGRDLSDLSDLGGLGGVGILGDVDRAGVTPTDDAVVEHADDRDEAPDADDRPLEERPWPSTDRADPTDDRSRSAGTAGGSGGAGGPGSSSAASDGGTEPEPIRTPGDESGSSPRPTDHYCGNCLHYDYVRTDDGIQPYCGYHDRLMDDMDPCEHWRPNAGR